MNKIFKSSKIPYLELIYNHEIKGCPKSHIHDKLTIILIEKENIEIVLENSTFYLSKNEFCILNPYQVHYALSSNVNSRNCYALYFDEDFIFELQKDMYSSTNYLSFKEYLFKDSTLYLDLLLLCKEILSNSMISKKEELIISTLKNIFQKYLNPNIKEKEKSVLTNKIKKYIDENIDEDLTLLDISEHFNISNSYLIRTFKKDFKLTPYQYILNKKIYFAKELLSKNIPISEVSLRCGFNDQSHLYKYFKEVYSISPKEYIDSLSF